MAVASAEAENGNGGIQRARIQRCRRLREVFQVPAGVEFRSPCWYHGGVTFGGNQPLFDRLTASPRARLAAKVRKCPPVRRLSPPRPCHASATPACAGRGRRVGRAAERAQHMNCPMPARQRARGGAPVPCPAAGVCVWEGRRCACGAAGLQ